MSRHLLALADWSPADLQRVLDLAARAKTSPADYAQSLRQKTLLMLFEKPSLRTRLSFEAGMTQLGGHAIFYSIADSPMGKKESIADTARAASRFVDVIMARLNKGADLAEFAKYATVPVINALDDREHPCQILADFQTIQEKLGRLKGVTITYFGDSENNVTYSILSGGAKLGLNVRVCCPAITSYIPKSDRVKQAEAFAKESGGSVEVFHDAAKAAAGADVIYTDSWMSYHIPADQMQQRVADLMPYQVTARVMGAAAKHAVFMNCLPAARGYEQTAEVIDGPQSIVFDQAENRLHAQKALLIDLLGAA